MIESSPHPLLSALDPTVSPQTTVVWPHRSGERRWEPQHLVGSGHNSILAVATLGSRARTCFVRARFLRQARDPGRGRILASYSHRPASRLSAAAVAVATNPFTCTFRSRLIHREREREGKRSGILSEFILHVRDCCVILRSGRCDDSGPQLDGGQTK